MILGGITGPQFDYMVPDNLEVWYPRTRDGSDIEGTVDRKGAGMCGNILCGGHIGGDGLENTGSSYSDGLLYI